MGEPHGHKLYLRGGHRNLGNDRVGPGGHGIVEPNKNVKKAARAKAHTPLARIGKCGALFRFARRESPRVLGMHA